MLVPAGHSTGFIDIAVRVLMIGVLLQVTSLRRLYANTYTDAEKQDAINLLLGNFVPRTGAGHIWDLESDIYLHTTGACGAAIH